MRRPLMTSGPSASRMCANQAAFDRSLSGSAGTARNGARSDRPSRTSGYGDGALADRLNLAGDPAGDRSPVTRLDPAGEVRRSAELDTLHDVVTGDAVPGRLPGRDQRDAEAHGSGAGRGILGHRGSRHEDA